MGDANHNTTVG